MNDAGKVHCTLLLSKARVSHLKKTTVARLEFTAATVAVPIQKIVSDHLSYSINAVYYWTDSMTGLQYIRNVKTRFHTLVANRVALIRESYNVDSWRFIGSALSPTDDASRGLSVKQLLDSDCWIRDPGFLQCAMVDWLIQPDDIKTSKDDL